MHRFLFIHLWSISFQPVLYLYIYFEMNHTRKKFFWLLIRWSSDWLYSCLYFWLHRQNTDSKRNYTNTLIYWKLQKEKYLCIRWFIFVLFPSGYLSRCNCIYETFNSQILSFLKCNLFIQWLELLQWDVDFKFQSIETKTKRTKMLCDIYAPIRQLMLDNILKIWKRATRNVTLLKDAEDTIEHVREQWRSSRGEPPICG